MAKLKTSQPSSSLADAIRANVPPPARRALCWHERLPAEVLAELELTEEQVEQAFREAATL